MEPSFHQSYTCVLRKISIKNGGTSLLNFLLNSGLRKFRHGISIVERNINLVREGGRPERDKLDIRGSTTETVKFCLQDDFVAQVD